MRISAPVKDIRSVEHTVQNFIRSKGWSFAGTCACTPKFDIYVNDKYPKWSIYVNGNMFKFKYQIVPGNNQTQVTGGLNAFETKYNETYK